MKFLLIQILKGYKYFISPLLGSRCRFYPSCSEYMMIAIQRFGVIKGIGLGTKRISRCHPGCEGGIDHVPRPKTKDKKPDKHENNN